MEYPTYDMEMELTKLGFNYIVGVDEAGRGPGAGPVVATAVYIPPDVVSVLAGRVNDSKKLTHKKRVELYQEIKDTCCWSSQVIDAEIIDEINILEATKIAMRNAVEGLEYYDYVLVDGTVDLTKYLKGVPTQQVIKGDAKSISIAAASVIAKVTRDNIMLELHKEFPIYGWDRNKGYLTKEHIEAINTYGITTYHRASFKKVGK